MNCKNRFLKKKLFFSRLSILLQDGVTGDLTNNHHVCLFSTTQPRLAWKNGLIDQQRPFFMHVFMSNIFASITNKYLYVCKVSNFLTLRFQSLTCGPRGHTLFQPFTVPKKHFFEIRRYIKKNNF